MKDSVNKSTAKKMACRIGARYLERWLNTDWSPSDEVSQKENDKIEQAVQELADELDRRSMNLVWPGWWQGPLE